MLIEPKEFEGVSFDPWKVTRVILLHTEVKIIFDNGGSISKHVDDEKTANELYH